MTVPDELAAALSYAARGWRVIPIKPGLKHPGMDGWQRWATTDAKRIRHWWTHERPGYGVGIATGAESGIFVLDVDISGDKRGDDSLADLEATYGALPATVEVITGSGGRHLYFRIPDGVEIRNDQAGMLGPGLDIRGEGGQVLAPPTLHPNGSRYEWEASSHPDEVPVADPPAWLVKLLTSAPVRTTRLHTPRPPDDDRPGTRLEAVWDWPGVLERDGATYLGTRIERTSGHPYELWARPGLAGNDLHTSGTLGYRGSNVLKVFSTSWTVVNPDTGEIVTLDEGGTYSPFAYLAATRHGGDYSACAKALADQEDTHEEIDVDELIGTTTTPKVDSQAPPEPWSEPIDFGTLHADLPAFPLDSFPTWIREHVQSVTRRVDVAPDLPATLALAAVATVANGHIRLRVREGYDLELNLYTVIALPPGEGKSPAEAACFGPIRTLEASLAEARMADIVNAAQAKRIAEKRAKVLEDKAVKTGDPADAVSAAQAALDAQQLEVPAIPRLLADDITPERLAGVLADHDGRIAIVSTEGGLFQMMGGRYSEQANLDVYLKAWSGDTILVDRVGRAREIVPRPALNIALTVQPHVLEDLADKPELAGKGLTARFCYAMPRGRVGWRRSGRLLEDHDLTPERTYADIIGGLGERWAAWQNPAVLPIDRGALELYGEWEAALEPRYRPDGDLHHAKEWASKLGTSVLRTAALLHLAEFHGDKVPAPVDESSMLAAIAIGDYWLAHGLAVHDRWQTDSRLAGPRAVLEWLRRNGEPEVSTRDIYVGVRKQVALSTMEEVYAALEILVERGWVRVPDGQQLRTKRGAKSTVLLIHPRATGAQPAQVAS